MKRIAKIQPETVKFDVYGRPYRCEDGMTYLVSPCHYAAATICQDDGTTVCRVCYHAIDERIGWDEPVIAR
jgi:hypothetical protein